MTDSKRDLAKRLHEIGDELLEHERGFADRAHKLAADIEDERLPDDDLWVALTGYGRTAYMPLDGIEIEPKTGTLDYNAVHETKVLPGGEIVTGQWSFDTAEIVSREEVKRQ